MRILAFFREFWAQIQEQNRAKSKCRQENHAYLPPQRRSVSLKGWQKGRKK